MIGVSVAVIPKRGFAFALTATIATMLAASAPSLFYPDIAESLDLTPVATTLVFAVYAFALLVTLLYLGPVSDPLGRRPVITLGSVLLATSIVLFWHADSLTALLAARGLQGVGAGIIIPALSAMLIDFEAPTRPGSASLWNTIGPMLGLGIGALGTAILLDITADPSSAVFGGLSAIFLLLTVIVWVTPERVSRTRVRWTELRPQFMVPDNLRPLFAASMPAIIAGWATNGLFLALGASLVRDELGGTTHTHAGVVIFTLAIFGIGASPRLVDTLILDRGSRGSEFDPHGYEELSGGVQGRCCGLVRVHTRGDDQGDRPGLGRLARDVAVMGAPRG